jgi:hypothetical protein
MVQTTRLQESFVGAIASIITQEVSAKDRRSCKLCSILDQLDDEDRASIIGVIDGRVLSFDKVASILKGVKFEVSPTTITRHYNNCEYVSPE